MREQGERAGKSERESYGGERERESWGEGVRERVGGGREIENGNGLLFKSLTAE